MIDERVRNRLLPGLACLVSVGLLLNYAKYRGDLSPWWSSHGGGIPYVMFWIFGWYTVVPRPRLITAISAGCVLFTCLLELAQLWNPEPLATFRATRFGAALLGSTFAWNDIPPYLVGGLAGWLVLRLIATFWFPKNENKPGRSDQIGS